MYHLFSSRFCSFDLFNSIRRPILFHSILFCCILSKKFYSILFCSFDLFNSIRDPILFHSILFCCILSIQFYSILLIYSIPFGIQSDPIYSILYSFLSLKRTTSVVYVLCANSIDNITASNCQILWRLEYRAYSKMFRNPTVVSNGILALFTV